MRQLLINVLSAPAFVNKNNLHTSSYQCRFLLKTYHSAYFKDAINLILHVAALLSNYCAKDQDTLIKKKSKEYIANSKPLLAVHKKALLIGRVFCSYILYIYIGVFVSSDILSLLLTLIPGFVLDLYKTKYLSWNIRNYNIVL